jgi:hypothetical protein
LILWMSGVMCITVRRFTVNSQPPTLTVDNEA